MSPICHPGSMSDLEKVRSEVAALRTEVDHLRDKTADTRVLAIMADRDVAGMRLAINGITQAQNALRQTQIEHGKTICGIAETVGVLIFGQEKLAAGQACLVERVGRHEELLTGLAAGQEKLAAGQACLVERVGRHEELLTGLAAGQEKLAAGQACLVEKVGRHEELLTGLAVGQAEILRRLPSGE
jgi:hypothetical protein